MTSSSLRSSRVRSRAFMSFFFLILIIMMSIYGTQLSWEDDRECLRAFKNSVLDPQGYLRDWNSLSSSQAAADHGGLCGWNGVNCSGNNVMALSLRGAGLHSQAPFSSSLAQCFSLLQLDLSHNSFQGPIPEDLCTQLPYLTHLDMSHNQLVGSIPRSLGNCSYLTALHLDNNLLSGEIPWQLSALPLLTELDLSYNRLSGTIPSSFASTNHSFPASAFVNNPHLCGPPLQHSNLCVNSGADLTPRLSPAAKEILLEVGTPMLALLIIVVLGAWYCWTKGLLHKRSTNKRGSLHSTNNRGSLQHISKGHPIKVTWEQLHKATKGFNQANIVGFGGSSTVYKGKLKDGRQIAVKLMTRDKLSLVHTPKELFLTEVKVLGKLRHRNLVRILGHSIDNSEGNMAIILDYIPMGSLDTLLHRSRVLCEDQLTWRSPSHLARWKTRINILLGIAEGLDYLHHDYDHKVCVIHGDLKPSNVLLDENLEVHIADFGFARIVGAMNSTAGISRGRVVPTPCWSVGYTAPECVQQGVVSRKADVFSFGIIVLELITGKRPGDNGLKEGESLVEWVSKALADEVVERVVAPALLRLASNQAPEVAWFSEDMKSVLRMGCQCASITHAARPNMHEVVALLRQLRDKVVSVELEQGLIKILQTAKNLSQPPVY